MGQNAHIDRSQRGLITIDWMVLAVACVTLLFLLGSMLRTSVEVDGLHSDGLRELDGDDHLLAYQDFSFNAAGWDPAVTSDRMPGQGPVLGPFAVEPVQRSFAMPANAQAAQITFDLHLVGAWEADDLFHVSLDEAEVLTIGLPDVDNTDPDALVLRAAENDGLRVFAQRTAVSPRPPEAALPGPSDDFVTLRIGVEMIAPPETLTLRLLAEGEGDARWTLDNLTVVAIAGTGVATP